MSSQLDNKRIARNTMLLYVRMLLLMGVQLYTSRVVLAALGVVDFGIYNIVGGVVALFAFLNSSMTVSTQRYLSYHLGRGDAEMLHRVFTTSVHIHAIIALLIIALSESVGLWYVLNKLVIPPERLTAALWVYQFSVLTTAIAVMSYPFNAAIIAHERMSAFAYISVLEAVLKLGIVFLLLAVGADRLIVYAVLVAAVQASICFIYATFCRRHFAETRYRPLHDAALLREMGQFAGWNLWGALAGILYTQGLNLLLNFFFGPVVNAARAIAVQVQMSISQFCSNFQTALNPQITKSYAAGELPAMRQLVTRSSKFSFLLLLTLCLPVIMEAPTLLSIWLHTVPDNTVIFVRLVLIAMMIDGTSGPLVTSAQATGRIRVYQTVVGGILIANLPISYVVLRQGCPPWSVYVVYLFVTSIAWLTRLAIVHRLIGLSARSYLSEVAVRSAVVAAVAAGISLAVQRALPSGLLSSAVVVVVSLLAAALSSYVLGLDADERRAVWRRVKALKDKLFPTHD